jgi:type II restriction/modification system DNA methylase subunit YeeA
MNKANLKSYAPKARLDFIKAVTERANVLGISAAGAVPAEVRGDVALIDGREWPAKVARQRDELIARIKRHGFEQTMDEVAYTWFNRFAALRYMEIHDYLGHGWRVLSSRDGGLPEILRHASEVTLPGLSADRAREMQLAGNQDNELYKLLLVAQCNELSRVMPFLFERIDDETELLLHENLLRTDSIVAKLVEQVPEEDWQEIEVIGWLYQFYISEKKDQVIGKVVKSEDIPAATQLFTPNWIVQYLVQNSVGRLWLMANPTSTLASQWPYYIKPAEQTPEVQAQLDALIQMRIREDGETLNPETITVLDPACGSGHILVVAYDVLKAIYLERGYQPRSIPRLILEKNLYGLDIDDRAAQLAAFALLMKARSDDRRLFNEPPRLSVFSLQESKGLDVDELQRSLAPYGTERASIGTLLEIFGHAKTFGSLIQVPVALSKQLAAMATGLNKALVAGDMYAQQAAKDLMPLVLQARLLGMQFDAVVANPPYMGGKGMAPSLKQYALNNYKRCRPDLYAMFFERGAASLRNGSGALAFVTMHSWMFLPSFEEFRLNLLNAGTLISMVHLGARAFNEIPGEVVQSTAFTYTGIGVHGYSASFIDATEGEEATKQQAILEGAGNALLACQDKFRAIPGSPIAYWVKAAVADAFGKEKLGDFAEIKAGIGTSDNDRFLRYWHEVDFESVQIGSLSKTEAIASGRRWFPYTKGGRFRKWYGNNEFVVNWFNDGEDIKLAVVNNPSDPDTTHWSRRIFNTEYFYLPSLTWSDIGAGLLSVRKNSHGFIHDAVGVGAYRIKSALEFPILAMLNSCIANEFTAILCPTLHFKPGQMAEIPVKIPAADVSSLAQECAAIAQTDWDSNETSWDFKRHDWCSVDSSNESLAMSWSAYRDESDARFRRMLTLEEKNNSLFIEAYGLHGALSPEVPEQQITLARADRERDCQRLVSYAIGCMMGRYSLEEPGLIYAKAGNVGFEVSRYAKKFHADADGIVPLTIERWFEDDAASRMGVFLRAVWGTKSISENMAWLAESLGTKGIETPDETVRRYLADKFFKEHLQTYKKRPIYWLFSSGKQSAFQALVYLHRYNDGTLARMRAEYVVPLITKMASRLDMLERDVTAASSAAARTKLQKQIEALRKKQIELLAYDEKLRHYADLRIALNLDDGVKVNYAKFGDLVAESKAITGGSDE